MLDCSAEIDKFYKKKVVLSKKDKDKLWESRRKNIKRLKKGLEKYNEENNTEYNLVEDLIQGSVSMHTVVQNDENNYDIDVAIVFDEDDLGDKGPESTRNMVANALKKETAHFSEYPEVKTGCIRIKYSTGYHVDFAVFKRYKENDEDENFTYEHAGAEWSIRDIRAIEEWFSEKNESSDGKLRKIVRLSKMFTRSRDSWKNMPSGLIQTVLCEEELADEYDRIDEAFYYTMKNIYRRLLYNLEVEAPSDNGRALVYRESDYKKMKNWRNRLKNELNKLDILFNDCSKKNGLKAWGEFFNNSYWDELVESSKEENYLYTDTEEFIEDKYPVDLKYNLNIECVIEKNGFRTIPIYRFLNEYVPLSRLLPHNFDIRCSIKTTDCPSNYKILWKVKNVGKVAKKRDMIRGQIQDRGKNIKETSHFYGPHYIECYLIKNGVCVAVDRVDIPIGDE
ncbi:nucleotide-binding domain-containing protein [Streptococcus phocae subsp. phocae]